MGPINHRSKTMKTPTFLFSTKGYSFWAHDFGDIIEVTLDKDGNDFIGISVDTVREARAAAKEWLAEQD